MGLGSSVGSIFFTILTGVPNKTIGPILLHAIGPVFLSNIGGKWQGFKKGTFFNYPVEISIYIFISVSRGFSHLFAYI